jgi:hypothetical protein
MDYEEFDLQRPVESSAVKVTMLIDDTVWTSSTKTETPDGTALQNSPSLLARTKSILPEKVLTLPTKLINSVYSLGNPPEIALIPSSDGWGDDTSQVQDTDTNSNIEHFGQEKVRSWPEEIFTSLIFRSDRFNAICGWLYRRAEDYKNLLDRLWDEHEEEEQQRAQEERQRAHEASVAQEYEACAQEQQIAEEERLAEEAARIVDDKRNAEELALALAQWEGVQTVETSSVANGNPL